MCELRDKRLLADILLLACFTLALTASCTPATQGIRVYSDPPGARVLLSGVEAGTTPVRVNVSRKATDVVIRLEKAGYQPAEIPLKRSFDAWFVPKSCAFGCLWFVVGDITTSLREGIDFNSYGALIPAAVGGAAGTGLLLGLGLGSGTAYSFKPGEVTIRLSEQSK